MFYEENKPKPSIIMFNQPDTLIPDPYNPLDWNRYSYARYNPIAYTDPSGHSSTPVNTDQCGPDGIYCNPLPDVYINWDTQYTSNVSLEDLQKAENAYINYLKNPGYFANLYLHPSDWANSTQSAYLDLYFQYSHYHQDAETMILSGFTDPDSAKTARTYYGSGDTASGDFYSKMTTYIGYGGGAFLFGMAAGGSRSNTIGAQGEQAVANQLGLNLRRMQIGNRIYDGFDPRTGLFLEIKSTARGVVYPNAAIRKQLAIDMGSGRVMWIFVNGSPSTSLANMLQAAQIGWIEW